MLHARLGHAQPYVLSLFRIVVGLLFTCHGAASVFGALGREPVEGGSWPGWYAAVIQLAGGALVLLGLYTRTAAFVGAGSMAFAYFDVHQQHGLLPIENGGEPAAMFCWALLLLVFCGPGSLAVDRLLAANGRARAAERRQRKRRTTVPA